MRVQLGPLAVRDVEAARDHYSAISTDLSEGFREALDQLFDRLMMFPQGAPPVEGYPGVRRARLRRFPYGVFYRLSEPDLIEVLRVIHAARETGQSGIG